MKRNARPDNTSGTGAWTPPLRNSAHGPAVAADIKIVGDSFTEWATPGIFKQLLLLKASAILAFASLTSGILSILWEHGVISVEAKDCLVGILYFLALGGALMLSDRLNVKRAMLLAANTLVFQAWNTLFFDTSPVIVFVVVLGLWLPVYWTMTDPGTMKNLGLGRKGFFLNAITGLVMAVALTAYLAWGMMNFGFTFKIEPWRLIVNTAQVLPMYLALFSLLFMAWNRLRSWGLSQSKLILALAILSVSLNAPSFACVAAATKVPPATAFAGFTASTVIMILSTHFTFEKFRSAIPVACLFTAMAALLLMTGLT